MQAVKVTLGAIRYKIFRQMLPETFDFGRSSHTKEIARQTDAT